MSEANHELQETLQYQRAPRPLSSSAARRAWGDQRVRYWWLGALVLSIIMLFVAAECITTALSERALIAHGTKVTATVMGMDGSTRVGYTLPRTDSHEVELHVTLPNGQVREIDGTLPRGPGVLQIGQELPIKIDPKDPSNWTDQTQAVSWTARLVVPLLMVPIPPGLAGFTAILLVIAWYRRRQVLRIWRDGRWMQGVVLELRQSALAPLSRVVRYNVPAIDRRICSVLVPTNAGVPAVGEAIDLVLMPHAPHRAVVARLYEP